VQQLGWCTLDCPFTNQDGVGDAPDSYAYDGKRCRKWAQGSQPYGKQWAAGDVITVCIDLGPPASVAAAAGEADSDKAVEPAVSSQMPPTSHPIAGDPEQQASADLPVPPGEQEQQAPAQQQPQGPAGAGGPLNALQQLFAAAAGRSSTSSEQRSGPYCKGRISFWRNGKSLGTAFSNVRVLPASSTLAYFPAVSLSQVGRPPLLLLPQPLVCLLERESSEALAMPCGDRSHACLQGERCELNFGARPLLYPVKGYKPLQVSSQPC
jgi:hypothetical protein